MIKLIRIIFIQVFFLVILYNALYAEKFRGRREWMLRTVSARGAALGRGLVAIIDDANTVFWNPGGTAFLDGFSFSYNNDYFNSNILNKTIRLNSFALVTRFKNKYSIGFNGIFQKEKYLLSPSYPWPKEPKDYNFGISLGYRKGNIGLGVNFKYLYTNLDETDYFTNGRGFAGDLGVLATKNYKVRNRYPLRINYGVSLMNFYSSIKNTNTNPFYIQIPLEALPMIFRIGYNAILNIPNRLSKYNRFTISHNFEYFHITNAGRAYPRKGDRLIGFGLDFMLYEVFALRIGDMIQLFDENTTYKGYKGYYNGLSYGIGINLPINRIYKDIPLVVKYDYARFPYNPIELNQTTENNFFKTNSINIQYLF